MVEALNKGIFATISFLCVFEVEEPNIKESDHTVYICHSTVSVKHGESWQYLQGAYDKEKLRIIKVPIISYIVKLSKLQIFTFVFVPVLSKFLAFAYYG